MALGRSRNGRANDCIHNRHAWDEARHDETIGERNEHIAPPVSRLRANESGNFSIPMGINGCQKSLPARNLATCLCDEREGGEPGLSKPLLLPFCGRFLSNELDPLRRTENNTPQ